jgi:hypothetical protein
MSEYSTSCIDIRTDEVLISAEAVDFGRVTGHPRAWPQQGSARSPACVVVDQEVTGGGAMTVSVLGS